MNASFSPVKGFKIELSYSRELIASAIAAQVEVRIKGIAFGFLGLCEATVTSGRQVQAQVNGKAIQAREGVIEATTHAAVQIQGLAVELAIATGRRIQRQTLGWVLPPLNTLVKRYLSVRNEVQSALRTYIEGGVGEWIQVHAVTQGPVMLPSGDVETQGQELLTDEEAIAEAKNTNPVVQEEKESQSVSQLSDERPKTLEGDPEKGEEPGVATPKRRARGRSA